MKRMKVVKENIQRSTKLAPLGQLLPLIRIFQRILAKCKGKGLAFPTRLEIQ